MNFILALVSAALLVVLFPPYGYALLAPIALAPILIACLRESRWKIRFAFGYAAGLAYWFGLCHWIQWTMAHHGGMGDGFAWLAFVLFCLVKALQMGLFAAGAGTVIRRWYGPPVIAAMWVVLEWTHSWTGFEWLSLGNAASNMSVLLRLAPVTGVWGISFSLALMGAVIAGVAGALMMRTGGHPAVWLLTLPGLILLPDLPTPHPGLAKAAVVQPNIDDETLWNEDLLNETERRMKLFSLASAGRDGSTDVIVWPEVPAPFYDYDAAFGQLLNSTAQEAHSAILTGAVAGSENSPLNSALLIDRNGNRVSRYDKVNLVPFGEFVPWPFGLVTKKISTEAGDFAPGTRVVTSKIGTHTIGTFICYESVFPSYVRQFAENGAEVLFNISNDSWFGKTAARYQHLLIVRMRAVENDRWIVRATNDGVSGVIDPSGRVGMILPEYKESSAPMGYNYVRTQTFYTEHGDWFVLLCGLILASGFLATLLPNHKSNEPRL